MCRKCIIHVAGAKKNAPITKISLNSFEKIKEEADERIKSKSTSVQDLTIIDALPASFDDIDHEHQGIKKVLFLKIILTFRHFFSQDHTRWTQLLVFFSQDHNS